MPLNGLLNMVLQECRLKLSQSSCNCVKRPGSFMSKMYDQVGIALSMCSLDEYPFF